MLSPKSCRPAKRAYTIAKLAVALQGSGNLLQKLIARGGIERASVGSRHHRRPSGAGIEGKHLTYRRPHKQNQIEARQAQRFLGWREKKRANMVDKEKLDLEIRLTAIEYLLINMGKAVYLTAQVPAEKMREMRENAKTQLLGETSPGVDPSMGDHVGAELADRVEYLLGEIEILVADAYQQLDQQRKA